MLFRTKFLVILSLLIAFLAIPSDRAHSQQAVSVSVKLKDAFILSVDSGAGKLFVDLGDNTISTNESVIVNINSKTVFLNSKKNPIDVNLLRPGVSLEIDGEKFGTEVTATKVLVRTNLENWQVDLAGYFEKLDGETAIIDGQRIKLESGAKIKGAEDWKNKTWYTKALNCFKRPLPELS